MRVHFLFIFLFIFLSEKTGVGQNISFLTKDTIKLHFEDDWKSFPPVVITEDKICALLNYSDTLRVNDTLLMSVSFFPALYIFDKEGVFLRKKTFEAAQGQRIMGQYIFSDEGARHNLLWLPTGHASLTDENFEPTGQHGFFVLDEATLDPEYREVPKFYLNIMVRVPGALLNEHTFVMPQRHIKNPMYLPNGQVDFFNPSMYEPGSYIFAVYDLREADPQSEPAYRLPAHHYIVLQDSVYYKNMPLLHLEHQEWCMDKKAGILYSSNAASFDIYAFDIASGRLLHKFGEPGRYVPQPLVWERIEAFPDDFDGNLSKIIVPYRERSVAVGTMMQDEVSGFLYRFYSVPLSEEEYFDPDYPGLSQRKRFVQVYDREMRLLADTPCDFGDAKKSLHSIKDGELRYLSSDRLKREVYIVRCQILLE